MKKMYYTAYAMEDGGRWHSGSNARTKKQCQREVLDMLTLDGSEFGDSSEEDLSAYRDWILTEKGRDALCRILRVEIRATRFPDNG